MGVSSIREFAAPLMVGIVVGGYSSVCITGALWLVMKKRFAGNVAPAAAVVSRGAASAPVKKESKQQKPAQDPTQPKKKNRKRDAEKRAASEAAELNKE